VQDGQEALDAVREAAKATSATPGTVPAFSLIFMDIQMPNMDGIESTRHIRALGCTVPIVALTAFADESNRTACAEAGTNAFLPKPIKRAALKEVLKQFPVEEKCELKVTVEETKEIEFAS
jgi:osomolarity two-component system sensor histidine kinase SLN1